MPPIQGLAAHAAGAELLPFRYDPGELGPAEVEIAITHCGVCHSDIHLISNDWGISQYPFIPGHEVIGKVSEAGSAVKSLKAGDRVGLGWQANSCGECEWCTRGMENLCALSEPTCVHRHGGYADRIRANARFVIPIPEALESEHAAPLLCGGITVYNPLRLHGVNPASRVGVVGIGGLGHLGIQFASKFGYQVAAIGHGQESAALAKKLGASVYIDNKVTNAADELQKLGGAKVILATAPSSKSMSEVINGLGPNGKLMVIGAAFEPIEVTPVQLITGSRTIQGWASGIPTDAEDTLRFAQLTGIRPMIETYPLEKAAEAYTRMMSGNAQFRVVLTM